MGRAEATVNRAERLQWVEQRLQWVDCTRAEHETCGLGKCH